MRLILGLGLMAAIAAARPAAAAGPLLYLPFDGSASPAAAVGSSTVAAGPLTFEPGRFGQAVRLTSDLRLPSRDNWYPNAGTFAAWINLPEAGAAPQPRYLVALYGADSVTEPWLHNRFSLYAAGGRMHWVVWGSDGQVFDVSASIDGWQANGWHHVAATWESLDGRAGGASLGLFLDGKLASRADHLALRMGPVSDTLNIGRDGDNSPGHLDGLMDEVYVYGEALPDAIIAAAAVEAPDPRTRTEAEPPGAARPGWWNTGWPFRVAVTLPAAQHQRRDLAIEIPTEFATAAGRLVGLPESLDANSCRVVPEGAVEAVPAAVIGERVCWRVSGLIPAGSSRHFLLYFRLRDYDLSTPLQARRRPGLARVPGSAFVLPDYATDTYGKPWDFSGDDFAGIDSWGDKPEYIPERKVIDGVLHLQVKQDPYFIWGQMWGQGGHVNHPVDIDLDRYHILEIRLRQSLPSAAWPLFGRVKGSDELLRYELPVTGTGWQTVRIDLAKQAHWSGHITAFRINATVHVEAAVDIEWVRLLAVDEADTGGVETIGWPSAPATAVVMDAPRRAEVGGTRPLVVHVTDAAGRAVSGQPVTVRLQPGSGGALSADLAQSSDGSDPSQRRGLTDDQGILRVSYRASQQAGPEQDRLVASADFTGAPTAAASVSTSAGPAARLVVTPLRATPIAPGQRDYRISAQVTDTYGNPLQEAGHQVTFTCPIGTTMTPASAVTDADGSVSATLAFDPARCWVAWVGASDTAGAQGRSAGVCFTPDHRDWGVTLGRNGYFITSAGKAWLPLGGFYTNWVGDVPAAGEAGRKLTSFVDTTDEQKILWLKFLASQGVTAMRFMLRAHRPGGMEPMDIGGKVNPELYAEALHYMDLARPFGIRFLLTLHEGYDKPMYLNANYREKFCLPRWKGIDLDKLPPFQRRFVRDGQLVHTAEERYTDRDVIACQDQYAREIVGLLKNNPQVFGYELENEQVDVPTAWVNHQCSVIRQVDPRTPICMSHGGGGLTTADPLFWRKSTSIDFYTYHIYPDNNTAKDPFDYGLAVDVLTRYGRMVGRCFLGESVGDQWSDGAPEAIRRRVARDIIWFSLVEGNPGAFFWNSRGDEVDEFRLARQVTDRIDFSTWKRDPAAAQAPVPHPLTDDGWFRTRSGADALSLMSRETQHYLEMGADFDFTWSPGASPSAVTLDPDNPPSPRLSWVQPSPGFQASTEARADGSEGLCYVRNVSGTEIWESHGDHSKQVVRTVAPRPCGLQLSLGPGTFKLNITDLVSGVTTSETLPGNGRLDLGTTDHDFAVHYGALKK